MGKKVTMKINVICRGEEQDSVQISSSCFAVKLRNYKSSVLHFEKALDQAKLLQDNNARDAIQKVNTDIPPPLYCSCCGLTLVSLLLFYIIIYSHEWHS